MEARAEAFFTEEEESEERRFQEEGEDSFHSEGLADHAAGGSGELRPVGAELKFHGDAGDDSQGEADAENFGPEAGGVIPDFVLGAEIEGFQDEDEEGEAHGELRENVMEGYGEGEMQAMDG